MRAQYEVHGEGPFFVYDHDTGKCVSMISFNTRPEAEMFIELLTRKERGLVKENEND